MSSKHSILLGTDGPDGDSTTGKFITPSAHVLEANRLHSATARQSAATNTVGDRYITASPAVAAATSSGGFGDADGEAQQLLPSSRDSVAARLPFDSTAPRTLAPSDVPVAAAAATAAAPTGFIKPDVAESMSALSATFASMLAEASKGEEQEQKVGSSIHSLLGGGVASQPAATDAPSKLSTCFDLITSTATRIPLSTIIAASSSHPSHNGGSASSSVPALPLESYVVVEPIDWSRHHHDSTFARLTGVNRGADQVDQIAIELATERDELQEQLERKDKVIEQQRAQIEALQRQLREATRGHNGATTSSVASSATAAASPAPAAASPASGSSAGAAAAATGPLASLPSDADDDSGDELDIDEGMCDEEDSGHGAAATTRAPTDKKTSSTFAI